MRVFGFRFLLAAFVFLLTGCGGSDSVAVTSANPVPGGWTPPNPTSRSVRLQQAVSQALADNDIPGAVVGVYTPSGSWTSATGLADVAAGRPMSLDNALAWRSVTKSLTVTLVLQLVGEGALDLDAPVATYLEGVPNGESITLRHLAAMRSGLFNYSKDSAFLAEFAEDLTAPWTDEQLLAFAFTHPVNFAAGAQYEYSNTNTLVLGLVAESVTGQTVAQLIAERIQLPLGLEHSEYTLGVTLPSPYAGGYVYEPPFLEVFLNGSSLSSAGAMAGTLEDLRAWGLALVEGTLLPSDLQQQRFESSVTSGGPLYDSYGLGMGEIRGWWGHTGTGLGYQAATMTEPTTGSQIVILVNGTNADADVPARLASEIMTILGWSRQSDRF